MSSPKYVCSGQRKRGRRSTASHAEPLCAPSGFTTGRSLGGVPVEAHIVHVRQVEECTQCGGSAQCSESACTVRSNVLPQVESTATQVERVGLILSRLTQAQLIYSDPGQHVQLYTQTRTTMHTYTNTYTY